MGTPQGSVLAPLLFILFINDLILPGLTIKFADDTTVAISTDNSDEMLSAIKSACDKMNRWCFLNQLILNEEKTMKVHFYKTDPKIDIQGGTQTVKFLGTYMDSKFTWEPQIDYICSKLSRSYFAILKMKHTVPYSTLLTLYYALVHCHLNYNIILWGQAVTISRVFVLQKRIIRLIYGLKPLESCRPIFKGNRILTLTSIYILKCSMHAYRNKDSFQRNCDTHAYPTRNKNDFVIPKHTTALYEKSPYYVCVKIFNKLPNTLKEAKSLMIFRNKLKSLLYDHAFYTINEFMGADLKD